MAFNSVPSLRKNTSLCPHLMVIMPSHVGQKIWFENNWCCLVQLQSIYLMKKAHYIFWMEIT